MSELPDENRCQVCDTTYPVASLARDCEARHGHPLRAQDCPALLAKVIA